MQSHRGQGLLTLALTTVVAGVLLIGAGLVTKGDVQCRGGDTGGVPIESGRAISAHCSRADTSPALFLIGFGLVFVALVCASWGFRLRQAPPSGPPPG